MTNADPLARARDLRRQAERCVDMAANAADQRIFRACVQAAVAYQQQALAIEGDSGLGFGRLRGLLE